MLSRKSLRFCTMPHLLSLVYKSLHNDRATEEQLCVWVCFRRQCVFYRDSPALTQSCTQTTKPSVLCAAAASPLFALGRSSTAFPKTPVCRLVTERKRRERWISAFTVTWGFDMFVSIRFLSFLPVDRLLLCLTVSGCVLVYYEKLHVPLVHNIAIYTTHKTFWKGFGILCIKLKKILKILKHLNTLFAWNEYAWKPRTHTYIIEGYFRQRLMFAILCLFYRTVLLLLEELCDLFLFALMMKGW